MLIKRSTFNQIAPHQFSVAGSEIQKQINQVTTLMLKYNYIPKVSRKIFFSSGC